ncbi:hypothetical protein BT63DRAFT_440136 [Microthyrium microscopicum]|uniref:F-box domain-containing protein n=1 Tax=Microthyrium microscopicum TaxID=703497 RepID=A0A6A6UC76_9PEZI|nr:hypothetical protein BT63DRAFT_440136 [Microthyrium microscopicum]
MITVGYYIQPIKSIERLRAHNGRMNTDEALIHQSTIFSMPVPRQAWASGRNVLRHWIVHPEGENAIWNGVEDQSFQRSVLSKELVALSRRPDFDLFSNFLAKTIARKLFRRMYKVYQITTGKNAQELVVDVDGKYFELIAKISRVMLATIFSSIAVMILYLIPSWITRLGLIILFSFVFATVAACFTTARPIDIFAVTAACASVQVVFVGSTRSKNPVDLRILFIHLSTSESLMQLLINMDITPAVQPVFLIQELFEEIFQYLDLKDLYRLLGVCHLFNHHISTSTPLRRLMFITPSSTGTIVPLRITNYISPRIPRRPETIWSTNPSKTSNTTLNSTSMEIPRPTLNPEISYLCINKFLHTQRLKRTAPPFSTNWNQNQYNTHHSLLPPAHADFALRLVPRSIQSMEKHDSRRRMLVTQPPVADVVVGRSDALWGLYEAHNEKGVTVGDVLDAEARVSGTNDRVYGARFEGWR